MAHSSALPKRITLIAAVAQNGVIGAGNRLPWRLAEDLRRFKALTMGHPVIMGRKTFESLGRPLPGRRNIVVTRRRGYIAAGCTVAASLEKALAAAAASGTAEQAETAFIIGGAEIYAKALPYANCLELTEIRQEFPGDAHFPPVDGRQWREVQRTAHVSETGLAFDFVTYERRAPI